MTFPRPGGQSSPFQPAELEHGLAAGVALRTVMLALIAGATVHADPWPMPRADGRIPLTVHGDLYPRERCILEAIVDWNTLLGGTAVLAADSLVLIHADTAEKVPIEMAQDGEIRYASGNPILRLRWSSPVLAPFEDDLWHLYFRTVEPSGRTGAGDRADGKAGEYADDTEPEQTSADKPWTPLKTTFLPGRGNVLFQTSFEIPDPDRKDRPEYMHPGGRDAPGETTDRTWSRNVARTGKNSLKIARRFTGDPPRNTNRPFWWSWPPPIAVSPGQGLRMSAWIKAEKLSPGSVSSVAMEFRDKSGKRIQDGRLRLSGGRIPHDWLRLRSSATAPPGAASAVFWFSLHGEGEVYCDDVTITRIAGGDLPPLAVSVGVPERPPAHASASAPRSDEQVLSCGIATLPPVLDGLLDDACWQAAGRIDDLRSHSRIPGTGVTTVVLASADRDALYFAFECAEPSTDNLRANATQRDGRLWEDDSVELFLDTNRDLHTYYQIIVNSRGIIFDQDKGAPGLAGPEWDGPVSAAARVWADRWTVELRIGFNGLRLAEAKGKTWGLNLARSSFRKGRSLYVWAPVRKSFGEPQYFGRLDLPFDPTANVVTGKPALDTPVCWGTGALAFTVTNRRNRAVKVRVTAAAEEAGETRELGKTSGIVGPRTTKTFLVPSEFPEPGEVRVRYALIEEDTENVLYRTSVTHRVPEPLRIRPATLVSYLGEGRLAGSWTVGLAESVLPKAKLILEIRSPGSTRPVAESAFVPASRAGIYAVDVGRLPAGGYELRARLLHAGRSLAEASVRLERIRGPFDWLAGSPP